MHNPLEEVGQPCRELLAAEHPESLPVMVGEELVGGTASPKRGTARWGGPRLRRPICSPSREFPVGWNATVLLLVVGQ